MVFSGIKGWEVYAIGIQSGAVAIMECVERMIRHDLPLWVKLIIALPVLSVIILWRPVMLFASAPGLIKNGERAVAVVTEYRHEAMLMGSGNAEIIRYADKQGIKYERPLFMVPMVTRKVGRKYMIYFDPDKEDKFMICPQSFIAAGLWIALFIMLACPFVLLAARL